MNEFLSIQIRDELGTNQYRKSSKTVLVPKIPGTVLVFKGTKPVPKIVRFEKTGTGTRYHLLIPT
ncbi:hypothetical protein Hanom_Chr10g00962651 [Helianthus anomalus]